MPNTIAFADLTHTGKKIDATFMPFSVACIAAKLKKRFGDDVRVELFKYPQDLAFSVEKQAPRIAAFSNYCWNEDLSIKMAGAIKRRSPETVTVMGGPNCPYAFDELTAYLSARHSVDFYVVGEGEDAFIESTHGRLEQPTLVPPAFLFFLKDGLKGGLAPLDLRLSIAANSFELRRALEGPGEPFLYSLPISADLGETPAIDGDDSLGASSPDEPARENAQECRQDQARPDLRHGVGHGTSAGASSVCSNWET